MPLPRGPRPASEDAREVAARSKLRPPIERARLSGLHPVAVRAAGTGRFGLASGPLPRRRAVCTSVSVHVTSPTAAASCGVYNNTALAQSTNNFADAVSNRASEQVICPP